jgi:ribonuclease E
MDNQENFPSGDAAVELDDSASNKRKRDSDSDDDERETIYDDVHADDEVFYDNEPDGYFNYHDFEEDDDVEEEEDDEQDENSNVLILGGSDDDDEEEDDDNLDENSNVLILGGSDEDDDDDAYGSDPKEDFYKTCLRIARNDPTMLRANEWS